MNKVSLIIRCYNRLEYTIQTLSNIIEITKYPNYEIIIINNNSKDGTTEWLDWIQDNSPLYKDKFKHIKMNRNLGDWYGMVEGLKYISSDSEYIMQIDNDIILDDPLWLNKLVFTLNNTNNKMAMLKRYNVDLKYELKSLGGAKNLNYNGEELITYNVERPVCCYIIKTDEFREFTYKYKGIEGKISKYKLLKEFGYTRKISNVKVFTYLNRGKYEHTNKNVREFI
jgi:glycosyltransferase involved in cell wall biosynthesis